MDKKRILQRNSLAQHWARDWRALALTGEKNFPSRCIYLKSGTREEVIEEAEEGRSRRLPAAMPILDVKSVFCVFGLGLKTQCILCICSHKARIHTRWGPLDPTSAPQAKENLPYFVSFH